MGGAAPAGQAKDRAAAETKAEPKPGPDAADKKCTKSEGKGDGAKDPMDERQRGVGQRRRGQDPTQGGGQAQAGSRVRGQSAAGRQGQGHLDDAMKQLQDDLKSKDPQRREAAEEFIRRYMTNADDPKVRDAAKKTLEDAGLDPEKRPLAANKPQDDGDAPPDEPKTPPAEGKNGPDKNTPPQTKDNPPDDPKDKKGESKGDGQPPKDNDPMTPKQPVTPPATAKGRLGDGDPGRHDGHPNDPEDPPKPETPLAQPKTLLQLYNFWQRRAEGRPQGRAGRFGPAEGAGERRDRRQGRFGRRCSTAARSTARPVRRATRTAWGRPTTPTTAAAPSRLRATASRTRNSPSCCRRAAINENEIEPQRHREHRENQMLLSSLCSLCLCGSILRLPE